MAVQRLFARQVYRTILVAAIATVVGRTSEAAEIVCLDRYDSSNVSSEQRAAMLEHFPSGRLPTTVTCTKALIKGTIISGDGAKFGALLRKSHPFLGSVLLWSSGGSVEEAMKIGRLIRKGLVETEAPLHLEGIWPAGPLRQRLLYNLDCGSSTLGQFAWSSSSDDVLNQFFLAATGSRHELVPPASGRNREVSG